MSGIVRSVAFSMRMGLASSVTSGIQEAKDLAKSMGELSDREFMSLM